MAENTVSSVPETYRQAAEEVRAHLVAVRGGAPFLSPADAELLLRWLDAGVAVSSILLAIERAAESRRKRRSRLPLTLKKAAAHLGKSSTGPKPTRSPGQTTSSTRPHPAGSHPFSPVAAEARSRGAADLALTLETLATIDLENTVRSAAHAIRDFLGQRWEQQSADERSQRVQRCREMLIDLDLGFSDEDLDVAADELAHDEHRQEWKFLDTAHLWRLAHGVDHAS